jgi:NTP pyrophosphatase (non-canonical NTP hydrolase)
MALDKDVLKNYQKFVDEVTSEPSKSTQKFLDVVSEADGKNLNVSRILTAGIGLSGEVGEFNEIIKKILFQGSNVDQDTIIHLKKELGDVIWYVTQACIALDTDLEQIIKLNTDKLNSRFGGNKFNITKSLNRRRSDI